MLSLTRLGKVISALDGPPKGIALPSHRTKPWGTAHALGEPFAVINADDFYGRDFFGSLAKFLEDSECETDLYATVGFRLLNRD